MKNRRFPRLYRKRNNSKRQFKIHRHIAKLSISWKGYIAFVSYLYYLFLYMNIHLVPMAASCFQIFFKFCTSVMISLYFPCYPCLEVY